MLGPEQLALLSAVTEHDRMEGTVQENTNQRTPVVMKVEFLQRDFRLS
jgi:hypothetical protein